MVAHRADPSGSRAPGLDVITPSTPVRRARASFAESFAGADPGADAERRVALRRMKLVALSFLIGATGPLDHGSTAPWLHGAFTTTRSAFAAAAKPRMFAGVAL